MEEDRQIQEKPEVQRMSNEKEEPVQTMGEEEEEPVQTMGEEEEEPVQTMGEEEEEEPVQTMGEESEESVQTMGEEEEEPVQANCEEDESVQSKSNSSPSRAPSGFSAKLSARKGKGRPLPRPVKSEMENAFGVDFSKVRIHTDADAAKLNKQIKAQAFTHGNDIYFNDGKYDPTQTGSKRLLAHELTHVVQQGAAGTKIRRKKEVLSSTPVPRTYKKIIDDTGKVQHFEGAESGMTVIVLPDTVGEVPEGYHGKTSYSLAWNWPGWKSNAKDIVIQVDGKATVTLTIQTRYKKGVDPSVTSGYGRGTTPEDVKAGNTSLRFHEGTHGTEYLNYVRAHPVPRFNGKKGMTVEQFEAASAAFDKAMQKYKAAFDAYAKSHGRNHVDCVGTQADFCEDS